MGLKRTDEFRQDAVRIALTSGLKRDRPCLVRKANRAGRRQAAPRQLKLLQDARGTIIKVIAK